MLQVETEEPQTDNPWSITWVSHIADPMLIRVLARMEKLPVQTFLGGTKIMRLTNFRASRIDVEREFWKWEK